MLSAERELAKTLGIINIINMHICSASHFCNWGEPERAPLLRGKLYGGPCAKNRGKKRHTTVVWYSGSCRNFLCMVDNTNI